MENANSQLKEQTEVIQNLKFDNVKCLESIQDLKMNVANRLEKVGQMHGNEQEIKFIQESMMNLMGEMKLLRQENKNLIQQKDKWMDDFKGEIQKIKESKKKTSQVTYSRPSIISKPPETKIHTYNYQPSEIRTSTCASSPLKTTRVIRSPSPPVQYPVKTTRTVGSPSSKIKYPLKTTRIVRSPSPPAEYPLSTRVSYSRPRLVSERIVSSPIKRESNKCRCKKKEFACEYKEIIKEYKRCPMCNSVLIKKTLSPLRPSAGNTEGLVSHLGHIVPRESVQVQKFSIPRNEYQVQEGNVR